MPLTEMYKSKRVSMDEIVREVKSGDSIYVHPGGAAPLDLIHAFAEYAKESLTDVTSTHILTLGPLDYMDPALEGHVRHCAWFAGGNSRKAINEGRADWVPVFLGEIPKLIQAEHDCQDIEYATYLSLADGLLTRDKKLVTPVAKVAFPDKDVFSNLDELSEDYICNWA